MTRDREQTHSVAAGATDELDGMMLAPATLLEGLPDAVVATGGDERIVFVNALAERLGEASASCFGLTR